MAVVVRGYDEISVREVFVLFLGNGIAVEGAGDHAVELGGRSVKPAERHRRIFHPESPDATGGQFVADVALVSRAEGAGHVVFHPAVSSLKFLDILAHFPLSLLEILDILAYFLLDLL